MNAQHLQSSCTQSKKDNCYLSKDVSVEDLLSSIRLKAFFPAVAAKLICLHNSAFNSENYLAVLTFAVFVSDF